MNIPQQLQNVDGIEMTVLGRVGQSRMRVFAAIGSLFGANQHAFRVYTRRLLYIFAFKIIVLCKYLVTNAKMEMKKYKQNVTQANVLDHIECDRCHKVISSKDNYDLQETFSIDIHCGYGSKTWGDLHRVECDLCEECIYDLIKDFARVSRYA